MKEKSFITLTPGNFKNFLARKNSTGRVDQGGVAGSAARTHIPGLASWTGQGLPGDLDADRAHLEPVRLPGFEPASVLLHLPVQLGLPGALLRRLEHRNFGSGRRRLPTGAQRRAVLPPWEHGQEEREAVAEEDRSLNCRYGSFRYNTFQYNTF